MADQTRTSRADYADMAARSAEASLALLELAASNDWPVTWEEAEEWELVKSIARLDRALTRLTLRIDSVERGWSQARGLKFPMMWQSSERLWPDYENGQVVEGEVDPAVSESEVSA